MASDSFHRRAGLFLLGEGGVVVAASLAADAESLAADAASLMFSKLAVKVAWIVSPNASSAKSSRKTH